MFPNTLPPFLWKQCTTGDPRPQGWGTFKSDVTEIKATSPLPSSGMMIMGGVWYKYYLPLRNPCCRSKGIRFEKKRICENYTLQIGRSTSISGAVAKFLPFVSFVRKAWASTQTPPSTFLEMVIRMALNTWPLLTFLCKFGWLKHVLLLGVRTLDKLLAHLTSVKIANCWSHVWEALQFGKPKLCPQVCSEAAKLSHFHLTKWQLGNFVINNSLFDLKRRAL